METSPAAPSPKTEKWNRIGKKMNKIIAVIAIIVVGMIFLGQKLMMGTRYKVSDKESVNYSEKATEADAKKLGEILKVDGYFDGSKEVDVLLKKDEKEGTVVSFVIGGLGKDDAISNAFKAIGDDIAARGFGKPLLVRLLDSHLNTLKDIKVE